MKKKLGILCLSITLLLSACSANTTSDDNTTKTTIRTTQSTKTEDTTTAASTTVSTYSTSTTAIETAPSTSDTTANDTTTTTASVAPTKQTAETTHTSGSTQTTATTTTSAPTDTTTTTTSTTLPNQITFKATIRESTKNQPVTGVKVTVYADGSTTPAGSATTNDKGVAQIQMQRGSSYRVELSNLPTGYESNAFYTFATTIVNITIRKAAVQNEKDHSEAQYEIGRRMTNFALTDIDGNTYQLSSLLEEKQLIVVDFWYTTCEPCKMEFPYFESAVQKYGEKISLLAVNPFNDNQAMAALRQQLGTTFPMLKDTCNLYLGFDVTSYPTTVLIDSNGIIVDIHQGAYTSEEAFLQAIERYIH